MFTLDQVVPWGRSFDEYRRMFALTEADLQRKILGCADGPASFNAELTRRSGAITSIDPLYRLDARTIRDRIAATYDQVLQQTQRNRQQFVWDAVSSPEELGRIRMQAMRAFLEDYDLGKRQGRYVEGKLPSINFPEKSFDLAVCSHFLFLYSEHLSETFHRSAISELCRVACEVRIFPLLALNGCISPYVTEIVADLSNSFEISIETVPYEFQRGGNRMMRVRPRRTGKQASDTPPSNPHRHGIHQHGNHHYPGAHFSRDEAKNRNYRLGFTLLPKATRKTAFFPWACGEKKPATSSS
jgi:hypothetical protein